MDALEKVNTQSKLAIYIAERPYPLENDEVTYHSFLMLVDESSHPVTVLQQLHYNDDANGYFDPNVRQGVSDPLKHLDRFDKLEVFPVIGGNSETMLTLWNKALAYAAFIKDSKVQFSSNPLQNEYSTNCRTAVLETLKAIGIESFGSMYAENIGLKSSALPKVLKTFSSICEIMPLNFLKAENKDFSELMNAADLFADYREDERYLGPIKRSFVKIDPQPNPMLVKHLEA